MDGSMDRWIDGSMNQTRFHDPEKGESQFRHSGPFHSNVTPAFSKWSDGIVSNLADMADRQ